MVLLLNSLLKLNLTYELTDHFAFLSLSLFWPLFYIFKDTLKGYGQVSISQVVILWDMPIGTLLPK